MNDMADELLIPNATQIPNAILDLLVPFLHDREARVLMYLCRRTYGFQRQSDQVSLTQFVEGLRTEERCLDFGAGVSRRHTIRTLAFLKALGIVEQLEGGQGRGRIPVYRINLTCDLMEWLRLMSQCPEQARSLIVQRLDGLRPHVLERRKGAPMAPFYENPHNINELEKGDTMAPFSEKMTPMAPFTENPHDPNSLPEKGDTMAPFSSTEKGDTMAPFSEKMTPMAPFYENPHDPNSLPEKGAIETPFSEKVTSMAPFLENPHNINELEKGDTMAPFSEKVTPMAPFKALNLIKGAMAVLQPYETISENAHTKQRNTKDLKTKDLKTKKKRPTTTTRDFPQFLPLTGEAAADGCPPSPVDEPSQKAPTSARQSPLKAGPQEEGTLSPVAEGATDDPPTIGRARTHTRRRTVQPPGEVPPWSDDLPWPDPYSLMALYQVRKPETWAAIQLVSEARLAKCRQYLAQFPSRDLWEAIFAQLHQSAFLLGEGPHDLGDGLRNLDWLLQKGQKDGLENCLKVAEGRYRQRRNGHGQSSSALMYRDGDILPDGTMYSGAG
jgi:hypothetical protein